MAAPDEKKIDDIVAMLDAFVSGGGGHMNIRTASDGTVSADTTTSKTVTTMNSLDCAAGNLACNVPTLFEGMDTDEEDPETVRRISQTTIKKHHYRRKKTWQIQTSATLRSTTWYPC